MEARAGARMSRVGSDEQPRIPQHVRHNGGGSSKLEWRPPRIAATAMTSLQSPSTREAFRECSVRRRKVTYRQDTNCSYHQRSGHGSHLDPSAPPTVCIDNTWQGRLSAAVGRASKMSLQENHHKDSVQQAAGGRES
jgi:hypothetical protein